MADNLNTDDEIAEAILKDAAAAANRVVERKTIQPLKTRKAPSGAMKGPNWIELMPAIPGSTVNPDADAAEKEAAAMESSSIRKPGYDDATQPFVGEIEPPTTPGGVTSTDGINRGVVGTNSASTKKRGVDAAKGTTPA